MVHSLKWYPWSVNGLYELPSQDTRGVKPDQTNHNHLLVKFTVSPSLPSNALRSHYFFYAVHFSVGFFTCICIMLFIPILGWVCISRPLLHQTRNKSFSLNVFLPEEFRVNVITPFMSYPKDIYVLFKYIFSLCILGGCRERKYILSYQALQWNTIPPSAGKVLNRQRLYKIYSL